MLTYINKYFLLNLNEYLNIGIDLPINVVIFFLFIGLCIAICLVNYHRTYMARTIKQLIRHDALGEDKAKSLKELGLDSYRAIRSALSRDGQLTRVVKRVGAPRYTYEEYMALIKAKKLPKEEINFDEAQFYIDNNETDRARRIYDNYNTSAVKTAFFCLLFMVVFVCISLVMPEILSWINNLLG